MLSANKSALVTSGSSLVKHGAVCRKEAWPDDNEPSSSWKPPLPELTEICDVGEQKDVLTTCNGVLADDFTAALRGSHAKSIDGTIRPVWLAPETQKLRRGSHILHLL